MIRLSHLIKNRIVYVLVLRLDFVEFSLLLHRQHDVLIGELKQVRVGLEVSAASDSKADERDPDQPVEEGPSHSSFLRMLISLRILKVAISKPDEIDMHTKQPNSEIAAEGDQIERRLIMTQAESTVDGDVRRTKQCAAARLPPIIRGDAVIAKVRIQKRLATYARQPVVEKAPTLAVDLLAANFYLPAG